MEDGDGGGQDARLLPVLVALVEAGNAGVPDVALFAGLCESLRDGAAVPLVRSALQLENLHPVYYGYCLHWQQGRGGRLVERSRAFGASAEFRQSPYSASLANRGSWRWREADGAAPGLPLVRELAASGVTDFMAEIIAPLGALPPGITWATAAPGGFSDADASLLRALGPHLAPVFGAGAERRKLEAVLRTYLGAAAGREVREGRIQRGDVRRLEAVVLLTDLRGFTAMTVARKEAELLAALDAYFEAVADAVQAEGGEVLKFMGDGVLAVFPVEAADGFDRACRAALAAVRTARTNLAARAADGLAFTAVLHAGTVAYGNIGSRERLDFTVIGGAVNVASRIEALAKRLGEPTVASIEVARRCGEPGRRLGPHELRGVTGALELVAL